jgi:hypothetical protein
MTRFNAKDIVEKIKNLDIESATDFVLDLASKGIIHDPEKDPSPTTPSGSIPVYKKPNKKKHHKKLGRKKGHAGAFRKIPEKIDKREEHKLEFCPHCGAQVKDSRRQRKRYIEDIVLTPPEVTEHIVHRYWCPDCKKEVEPVVDTAMPGDNIGVNVYLYFAYLHYALGISIGNLVRMLSFLFHFRISSGALIKGWARLAQLLKSEYGAIGEKAKDCSVLHLDETGWRINGVTHWLWCFTNKFFCYYVIDKSRGSIVIKKVLGEIFRGTLISDFWSAYNKFQTWAKQKCLFHLFTELEKVHSRNFSVEWRDFREDLYSLLMQAVELWKTKSEIPADQFDSRRKSLEQQLDKTIEKTYSDADCIRLGKRLKKHRSALFTFLYNDDVSPYNNHAEQQMRKPVIARRICQQNRSDKGAETQAILMSIFRTAELRGENPISYVENLVKIKLRDNHNSKINTSKAA